MTPLVLLVMQNFATVCALAGLDPERVVFVIDGKAYRCRTH
jgi:enamine deaminase RidA (YjgF/YER057c/UK114 family)